MPHRKPTPLTPRSAKSRRVCPVCGTVSYSRHGVHPQCAQEQADAPRVERLKAAKKAAKSKPKQVNPLALSPWHKRCPKCQSQIHIRKMTCECGHQFTKSR